MQKITVYLFTKKKSLKQSKNDCNIVTGETKNIIILRTFTYFQVKKFINV